MLKERVIAEIEAAVRRASQIADDSAGVSIPVSLFATPQAERGDYSTDIAVRIARARRDASSSQAIAERIAAELEGATLIESAQTGPDGILNLRLHSTVWSEVVEEILGKGSEYGANDSGHGARVLVEFVSANPNVPLSVTHGRGGIVGDLLSALLAASGCEVQREFYVNDTDDSRPLRAFARAVLALYRQRCGIDDITPETEGYGGGYVAALARRIYEKSGDRYAALPLTEALPLFQRLALQQTQEDQRVALESFGIRFDSWLMESELTARGAISETLDALSRAGYTEERGGALWLQSTRFGDENDRVLRRKDGLPTYLAGDLAYHRGKFDRGFDHLIDVWSSDHSGYIARTRAGLGALGFDPARLDVVVFQSVRVLKDGVEIKVGSENGALEELIAEIGVDAARFHLALGAPTDVLDLDIDAARRADAPLTRIRNAYARALEIGGSEENAPAAVERFEDAAVKTVLRSLSEFPSVIESAVQDRAPQRIPLFAVQLAATFEVTARLLASNSEQPAQADESYRSLCRAVAQTLRNALDLLGISPVPHE